MYFERGDHKSLQRCAHDFERLVDKNPDLARPKRLSRVVETLNLLQHHKLALALGAVRAMIKEIRDPAFDFESASNLIGLLAQMAKRAIQLDEVHPVIDQLALRFSYSRSMTEVLAGAAKAHPVYAEHVRAGNTKVIKYAEYAMSLSLRGDPKGTVNELLRRGQETLNNKLLESAEMVLVRHAEKIGEAADLRAQVQALRALCSPPQIPGTSEGPRKAGALSLRVGGGVAVKKAQPA
jgi:hypothetical protein